MTNCTPLWRKAHFQVKTDHFLKFMRRKIARRCGAKHVCKSKCTKHRILRPFFEVQMSKNGTSCGAKRIYKSKRTKHLGGGPLFEVPNCTKHGIFRPLFEVQMSKNGTPLSRQARLQVKVKKISIFTIYFEALFEVSMSQRCLAEEIDILILNQSINQSISQLVNQPVRNKLVTRLVSSSPCQLVN